MFKLLIILAFELLASVGIGLGHDVNAVSTGIVMFGMLGGFTTVMFFILSYIWQHTEN